MKKRVFTGYTTKDWDAVWTYFNWLNIAFVIQKTREEASARYSATKDFEDIVKVRIMIEEVKGGK